MADKKYIKVFTVADFLGLVDKDFRIILHDAFEWETYQFDNMGALIADPMGQEFLGCWVYNVDISRFGVVSLTINDGFTDEDGNAYIVEMDSNNRTFVEIN